MRVIYETAGNQFDRSGYVSLNGYTMHREKHESCPGEPWVLRDPFGEFVDVDIYRYDVAERNGFELDEWRLAC